MQKIIVWILLFLCLALLLLSQEKEEIQIRNNAPFWYVCMDFSGGLDQEKISCFLQEARRQGLADKVRSDLFGIFYNSPLIPEGKKDIWGLGFEIEDETKLQPPLMKRFFGYSRVITTEHKGPFETVGNTMNQVAKLIENEGIQVIGPPVEFWIGDPNRDKPEDLKTKILVPINEGKK